MSGKECVFDEKKAILEVVRYVEPTNAAIVAKVRYEDDYVEDVVLTVNPQIEIGDDEVAVKTYSEGAIYGYREILIENGLIHREVEYTIPSGYVELPVHKLTEEALKMKTED